MPKPKENPEEKSARLIVEHWENEEDLTEGQMLAAAVVLLANRVGMVADILDDMYEVEDEDELDEDDDEGTVH